MIEIIERLERATEPARTIDGQIATLLGWTLQKMKGDQRPYWRKPGVTDWYQRATDGPPAYTASIDAALTLAPENAGLQLARYWLRRPEAAWRATLYVGGVPGNPKREFTGEDAYGPAIALCIAALKARAALSGEGQQ